MLLCLHENGGIGVRVCRRGAVTPDGSHGNGGHGNGSQGNGSHGNAHDDPVPSVAMELIYDLRCQSDALRVTKHVKVYGMACCPIGEKTMALIVSDGKTLFWDIKANDYNLVGTLIS